MATENISEARLRITNLLDEKSFVEIDEQTDKGVICGYGTINQRPVCVFSQDFSVFSGALTERNCEKICNIIDTAVKTGIPIIEFYDSMGAKLEEGLKVLKGVDKILLKLSNASGVIPQIAVISGTVVGISSYMATLADFVFMINEKSKMFINGPQTITAQTGKEVTSEEIGGSKLHFEKTGSCHVLSDNENECIEKLKKLFDYLPDNNLADIEIKDTDDRNRICDELEGIGFEEDVRNIIKSTADSSNFLEIQAEFAKNIVIGFARFGGRACGVVANQGAENAGKIDISGIDKACRFVRFCDAFNLPIITFVNCEGFLENANEENFGLVRKGAKILYVYADATVIKINIIVGKAFGGSALMLGANADMTLAWENAKLSVLDPKAASNILYNDEIESSDNPVEFRQQKISEYLENLANANCAAKDGFVQGVIKVQDTRKRIISGLDLYLSKRENKPIRKHGNMPI